ncbi:unnamed protein product [Tenebrio molitor]|nr:unnamed protein product [Tenebrio molitor]
MILLFTKLPLSQALSSRLIPFSKRILQQCTLLWKFSSSSFDKNAKCQVQSNGNNIRPESDNSSRKKPQ